MENCSTIDQPLMMEIAKLIVDSTGLKNINYSLISNETVLTSSPFNLDSIDVLEAVYAIEHKYKIKLNDPKEWAQHFQNMQSIVSLVKSQQEISQ